MKITKEQVTKASIQSGEDQAKKMRGWKQNQIKEQIVTSLDISKEFDELGIKFDSYFYHHNGKIITYGDIRGRTVSEENPINPTP